MAMPQRHASPHQPQQPTQDVLSSRLKNADPSQPSSNPNSHPHNHTPNLCPHDIAGPKDWVRGRLLGSGSFGRVNAAVSTTTGTLFAVKSVCLSSGSPNVGSSIRALENEIEILSSLTEARAAEKISELPGSGSGNFSGCPQIIQYLGSSWTAEEGEEGEKGVLGTCRNLHLELAPGGSIAGLLKDTGRLGLAEPLLRRYTADVTKALQHLHSRGIVHGDVKGLNVLIGDTSAKLADFGTAWRLDSTGTSGLLPVPQPPAPHPPAPHPMPPYIPAPYPRTPLAYPAPSGPQPAAPCSPGLSLAAPQHSCRPLLRSSSLQNPLARYQDAPAQGCRTLRNAEPNFAATAASGDLGSRAIARDQKRELRGSPYWMSPETVRELPSQGTAVDIWSLGCTVLEMATGRAPWSEVTGGLCAVLYAIGCTAQVPGVPGRVPPVVRDFISCCLRRDPGERWTAEQLLQHPFLTGHADVAPDSDKLASGLVQCQRRMGGQGGGQEVCCQQPSGCRVVAEHCLLKRSVSCLPGSDGAFQPPQKHGLVDAQQLWPRAAVGTTEGEHCFLRRTASCLSRPDPVPMLECLSHTGSGCSSIPSSGLSNSPGSRSSGRKRGFSPLGCMVLEKAQALKPECMQLPPQGDHSSKRKRGDDDDTMTSSFPLLDLSLLKDRLPPGSSLQDGDSSPLWPNSPLSQQGAGWIVVHSPKKPSQGV